MADQAPAPKKKTSWVVMLLAGVFGCCILTTIIGRVSNSGDGAGRSSVAAQIANGAGSERAEAAAPVPAAELAQLPWLADVTNNCAAYKAAPNEIKKSAVFNRNSALLSGISVKNIRGKLTTLRTNQGGDELTLRVGVGDVEFKTEGLFDAIKKGSNIYNAAADLSVGQCVVFSAKQLKASSLVEQSQVCDPEYFVKFTALGPCQ